MSASSATRSDNDDVLLNGSTTLVKAPALHAFFFYAEFDVHAPLKMEASALACANQCWKRTATRSPSAQRPKTDLCPGHTDLDSPDIPT
jgi:hypothetical protein